MPLTQILLTARTARRRPHHLPGLPGEGAARRDRDDVPRHERELIQGLSTESWKAVGAPGTVMGLETARTRYAREGFVLGQGDAAILALEAQGIGRDPTVRAIFLPAGRPLTKGERLVQRDLAATLSKVSAEGPDAFYKEPIGAAIADASRAYPVLSFGDDSYCGVSRLGSMNWRGMPGPSK